MEQAVVIFWCGTNLLVKTTPALRNLYWLVITEGATLPRPASQHWDQGAAHRATDTAGQPLSPPPYRGQPDQNSFAVGNVTQDVTVIRASIFSHLSTQFTLNLIICPRKLEWALRKTDACIGMLLQSFGISCQLIPWWDSSFMSCSLGLRKELLTT